MKTLIWDILTLAGFALLVYGTAAIYSPLGWILAGIGLTAFGFFGARTTVRNWRNQR